MQFSKRKLSGIDIEKDKISKIFRFALFWSNFRQNIDRRHVMVWNIKTPKTWAGLLFL